VSKLAPADKKILDDLHIAVILSEAYQFACESLREVEGSLPRTRWHKRGKAFLPIYFFFPGTRGAGSGGLSAGKFVLK
jgi:hypothetical protein